MADFESGMVVVYSYLWAREFDRGEESGRKDRPVCVQVLVKSGITRLFVPITSQPPIVGRAINEIPHFECQRAGLRAPAWIVVDEFNIDETSPSVHLRSMKPLGVFATVHVRNSQGTVAGGAEPELPERSAPEVRHI